MSTTQEDLSLKLKACYRKACYKNYLDERVGNKQCTDSPYDLLWMKLCQYNKTYMIGLDMTKVLLDKSEEELTHIIHDITVLRREEFWRRYRDILDTN